MATEDPKKSNRGFAARDPAKLRELARKGAQSVPAEKRSFAHDPKLAAAAGRKGGQAVPPANRSFSRNPALASEAGQKGGHASRPRKARTAPVEQPKPA